LTFLRIQIGFSYEKIEKNWQPQGKEWCLINAETMEDINPKNPITEQEINKSSLRFKILTHSNAPYYKFSSKLESVNKNYINVRKDISMT
jgi:hypothetical protein